MADDTILVLGGTGKTGSRVVRQLTRLGTAVKAASRAGTTRFDWQDETTWEPALTGATGVFLVDSQGADALAELRAFAGLAADSGVRRLVLLSARPQESGDPDREGKEQAVKDSGAEWTVLRPTWFAQNFSETPLIRDPLLSGELVLPAGDGRQPFIDADDIAEVAVAALTRHGHAGRTYDLSGPEALTFAQAVAFIAVASGRRIEYRAVTGEEYVAHARKYFIETDVAENFVHLLWFIAAGKTAELSDGVPRALGREPTPFADYASSAALGGAWDI